MSHSGIERMAIGLFLAIALLGLLLCSACAGRTRPVPESAALARAEGAARTQGEAMTAAQGQLGKQTVALESSLSHAQAARFHARKAHDKTIFLLDRW